MTETISEAEARARLVATLPYPRALAQLDDMLPWFSPALSADEQRNPPYRLRDFADLVYCPGAKQWIKAAGLLPFAEAMQPIRRELAATRTIELLANPTYHIPEDLGEENAETFETSNRFRQAWRLFQDGIPATLPTLEPGDVFWRAVELLAQDPALLATTRAGYFASWRGRWLAADLPEDQYRWAELHLKLYHRSWPRLEQRHEQGLAIDFTLMSEEHPPQRYAGMLKQAGIYEEVCAAWLSRYEQALRWWKGNNEPAIQAALSEAKNEFSAYFPTASTLEK